MTGAKLVARPPRGEGRRHLRRRTRARLHGLRLDLAGEAALTVAIHAHS